MAKKNSDYWQGRFEQLEKASHKDALTTYSHIEQSFEQAQREIERNINNWYIRFANNNQITITEAKKILNANELKELKWDIQEYIKYGQENELNAGWMKELENASAKFHISRLEALKLQTQQTLEKLFGNELDEVDKMTSNAYTNNYYHTMFEMQKGFNVGFNIGTIDENKLSKIVSKPWAVDEKNFSERIWNNKTKMINELHNQLTIMCVQGKSPDSVIKYMSKKFNTSKAQAGNLVMTESAYFSSLAQKDCFKDLDVEEYEIVATLDSHTSEICRSLDGKVFPMKDFESGITAPPFHVYCRSTTVPHFDENFGQAGERAARGVDGKTYYVPDDMNYMEWKKTFVDGGDKSGFIVYNKDGDTHWTRKEKVDKIKEDIKLGELEKAYGKKHYKAISKFLSDAPEIIQRIWNECVEDFHCLEPRYRGTQAFYSPSLDGVKLNISSVAKGSGYQTPYQVVFHEYGHHADYILNRKYGDGNRTKAFSETYQNGIFGQTIKAEARQAIDDFAKIKGISEKVEAEREFCLYMKEALSLMQRADISDMFEPVMSKECAYPFGVGHGANYWKTRDNGKEGFAEMYSATVNNPESLEQIKYFFPKAYKIFLEMLEVVK